MKALRVSVCIALWLTGVPGTAQEDEIPSADFLDFLASWDVQDQEWLDNELENVNREHGNTNDEETSDVD
ncbi:MAG: hypothetical protein ACR2P1_20080 [Pseudomonadales bacterium]